MLQVRIDIPKLGHGSEFLFQYRSPGHEIFQIVALQCVLILSVAGTAAYLYVLHGLQEERRSRDLGQAWPQTVDHLIGSDLSLRERLERDIEVRRIGPANEAGDHIDSRIASDDIDILDELLPHGLEGNILGSAGISVYAAGVLLREKTLGNVHV